jgi:hypothetical protein
VELAVLAPDADLRIPAWPLLTLEADPDDRLLPPVQHAVRERLGLDRAALELGERLSCDPSCGLHYRRVCLQWRIEND